jgi:hypothetical protein
MGVGAERAPARSASPNGTAAGPASEVSLPLTAKQRATRGSFGGAVIGTAPLSAIVAALITVATWPAAIGSGGLLEAAEQPMVGSFLNLAFAWLALALLHWLLGFDRADRADARSYGSLIARRDQLQSRLRLLTASEPDTTTAGLHLTRTMALEEARDHLAALDQQLQAAGPGWVLGHAYMDTWRRLNRAEEALLECAPATLAAAEAKFDMLRLQNSAVDQASEFQSRLQTAIDALQEHVRGGPQPAAAPAWTAGWACSTRATVSWPASCSPASPCTSCCG